MRCLGEIAGVLPLPDVSLPGAHGVARLGIWTLLSAAAVAVALASGCAKEIAVPNLPAVPVVTAPDPAPAPPPPPVTRSLPATPAPPIGPPLTPAPPLTPRPLITTPPPAPPPRPAPSPPAPAPAPPQVATTPPPAAPPRPAPVLSPHVGSEEERRMVTAAQTRIDDADRAMARVDQKKLGKRQLETLTTIQSFIVKAREALGARDFERAFTLADKAHVLAEEITTTPR